MANNYFSFKQFTVWQDRTAMKVGTDGVLLGALTKCAAAAPLRILDVGTGTGLVALMLAQRFPHATIDAIDIDAEAAQQAAENFEASPFRARLTSRQADIATFSTTERYDVVASNPPYYNGSLLCPDPKRNLARHDIGLTYNQLAASAAKLLAPSGTLTVIVPTDVIHSVVEACASHKLHLISRTDIYPTPTKPSKRVVAAFSFCEAEKTETSSLVLETAPRVKSADYQRLTADFYLDKK